MPPQLFWTICHYKRGVTMLGTESSAQAGETMLKNIQTPTANVLYSDKSFYMKKYEGGAGQTVDTTEELRTP